jgi:hypothetical protein
MVVPCIAKKSAVPGKAWAAGSQLLTMFRTLELRTSALHRCMARHHTVALIDELSPWRIVARAARNAKNTCALRSRERHHPS